jgi:iron(III) transport system permease protein
MSTVTPALTTTPRERRAVPRLRRRGLRGAPRSLLVLCALVALVAALPVVITIVQGLQGGTSAALKAIDASSPRTLLLHSVLVALVAAPLAGVLGVGSAWFIERTSLPGRWLWTLLAVAPLTMPLFVTSYAWATIGNLLQGFLGAAGIVAFAYYPIVFLLCAVALRGMDPALEESARSLGLSARRTFFRVILPQLRPAMLGGMLLVVLDTLVEFDAFVALKYQTFTVHIYAQYELSFSASGAAALSFVSIVVCVLLLLAESRLRGGANYTRVSQGARRPATRYRLGRATLPVLIGFLVAAVISIGIPLGTLVYWFTQSSHAGLEGASANIRYLGPATLTSVGLGVAGAVLAVLLALPVAFLVVRHRGRLGTILERATYLSFALPDLVAAIALAYAASRYAPRLYGSIVLLVLAEAMLFVPFAIVALRATIGQIEPALEDSARSLGLSRPRAFARVTLPLSRPGLAAAGVLVFAFVLGDLGTTQVLLPPGLYTLGTEFQANSATAAFAAAAPFAAVLVGLSMLAAGVLMSRFGKVRTLRGD